MRRLRFKILVAILILSGFFIFDNQKNSRAEQNKQDLVCFRWAFGAMIGSKNDRRLVAITRDTILKTGDQLKMLVELQKKCFVYLIYHTGQDELHLLFPYDIGQFTSDYDLFKKYYIPQGDMWFELDEDVGHETFYLLASARRLFGLEALLEEYKAAEAVMKRELAKKILVKIRKEKKRHRKFTTSAERPVTIGGSVRGVIKDKKTRSPDIDPIAAEVNAPNFYSRTFTIEHQ
jgi:hypothetical protein